MHPATRENLEQLLGFEITGIGETEGDEVTEPMQTLTLEKGGGPGEHFTLTVYISSDEEGNGPGHLMIEEV